MLKLFLYKGVAWLNREVVLKRGRDMTSMVAFFTYSTTVNEKSISCQFFSLFSLIMFFGVRDLLIYTIFISILCVSQEPSASYGFVCKNSQWLLVIDNSCRKSSVVDVQLFYDGGPNHIETSLIISVANQWTGFYMIWTFVTKELIGFKYDSV